MAKKNLPNIPIYIGDWERDCNVLSLEAEAAWMRIVFKLWTKGKQNTSKMPAKSLQNLWRCGPEKVKELLDELKYNNICEIKEDGGFVEFTCRRFVKENELSDIRSKAAKGEREAAKFKQTKSKSKAKHQQNADNENENESEYEVKYEEVLKGSGETFTELWPTFEDFWEAYDKKVGSKVKIKKKWKKLPHKTKEEIMQYIPAYIHSQPNKKYRKNPETFLANEGWNDEIITAKHKTPEQIAAENRYNYATS